MRRPEKRRAVNAGFPEIWPDMAGFFDVFRAGTGVAQGFSADFLSPH